MNRRRAFGIRRGASAGLIVATLLFLVPVRATPVLGATPVSAVLDTFDASPPAWYVASGSGNVSRSTSGVLVVGYNFTSVTQLQLAPTATRPDLPGLPRRVCVDTVGDGSWNVLYLQLRDATGEIFHYRLGNMSTSAPTTFCVRPGVDAAVRSYSGNGDGILDLPLALFRLVVDRNPGGTKISGQMTFDNLRVEYEAWSPLRSDAHRTAPSAGQRTTLRLGLQESGTFSVVLTDGLGATRTWSGSAAGAGAEATLVYDGKSSAGAVMNGCVRATLKITRGSETQTVAVPYLVGLAARYEPPSPGSIVGVNSYVDTINTNLRASAETQARAMENAYVRMAREEFDWNLIEPRKGWFEWAKFDQAVEVLGAHNVGVLGKLVYSAGWASSAPAGTAAANVAYYPPKNVADYAAYARAVVHRYKGQVHAWEIWNEENYAKFWQPAPNAAAYTALLKAAYAAIKAEDPSATVMIGGLAASDRTFLRGIYAAGGWSSFDAVAIHTYVTGAPEPTVAGQWLDEMRAYVASVGAKPIWITEVGWTTYTGSGVSQTAQAQFLSRFYEMAAAAGMAGVFWFQFQARSTSTTSAIDNYAVVNADGSGRAAYTALRRIGEALDGGSVVGAVAPNASKRVTVDAMTSPTGWSTLPIGGGSASLTKSGTTGYGDTSSLALNYVFTSSSTGVELRRNLTLPGSPTSISAWVRGDGSANPVHFKVTDATGETFQARAGSLLAGWQRLTMRFDGGDPSWKHSGGDNDGKVDYPAKLTSIFVYRGGIGRLSGTAWIDEVSVESGTPVRGLVVSRRNGVEQVLYTLSTAATQSVPVGSTKAWLVDGPNSTALTVSGGAVSVGLSATPLNVLSGPSLSATQVLLYPDGRRTSTTLTWVAGDGGTYTLQLLNASGSALGTIVGGVPLRGGIVSRAWDGSLGGVAVSPGSYQLQVLVTGVDGRVTKLVVGVTVAKAAA